MYDCNQVTGYCELQYDFCFLLFNIKACDTSWLQPPAFTNVWKRGA